MSRRNKEKNFESNCVPLPPDEYTIDYLVTNALRAQRNDIFLRNSHIFLSGIKKKFYYKKLKIMTTDDTKLNFLFKNKKMSFDDKEFCRIILN